MNLRSIFALISITFLASCSSKSSSTPAPDQSNDASQVTLDDFDPSKAPKLDGTALSAVVSELSAPSVPNFSSSPMSLTTQRRHLFSPRLDGVLLTDTYDDCIANTKPTVDRVTANDSTATYDFKTDYTACLNDEIARSGATVSNSSCTGAIQMKITCPGKNFGAANGKAMADAAGDLGMGVSDCKPTSGNSGKVTGKFVVNCSIVSAKDGKTYSYDSKVRGGFMNSKGAECEFTYDGGQIVLGDCFDALAQLDNEIDTTGEKSTKHTITRYRLKGAKISDSSTTYTNGQSLGFDVNDWTGTIVPHINWATYNLTNGSETSSGRIYP